MEEKDFENGKRFYDLDMLPVAVFETDLRGNLVFVNENGCRVIGYSREELLGQPFFKLVAPEDRSRIIVTAQNVLSGKFLGDNEFAVLRKDGTRISTFVQSRPIKNSRSEVTGLRGVLIEITRDKTVEAKIFASEEKYRTLVNNLKLGIFRTTPDPKGKLVEFNQTLEFITGYSREELLALDVSDLYCNPEDRKLFIERTIATPRSTTSELYFQKKDHTRIAVSVTASAVRDESDRVIYFDGTLEDITERKMMEQRIIDLYEKEKIRTQELREEAQERSLFIDILAHELRTPLAPIISSTSMLQDLMPADPDSARYKLIFNIKRGAEALASKLDELLELARYSRGAFKLNLRPVLIKSYLEEIISRFKPSIQEHHQNLKVTIADNIPAAWVDASRLEQVLVNLLSNASKFSPDKGNISVNAFLNEGELVVEVRDDGIGITPEEQKKLFRPYHRVDQDRHKFPGLGLGLAVCKQIVEAHGGLIRVASQPGQGSTFSFRIPLQRA